MIFYITLAAIWTYSIIRNKGVDKILFGIIVSFVAYLACFTSIHLADRESHIYTEYNRITGDVQCYVEERWNPEILPRWATPSTRYFHNSKEFQFLNRVEK
jgi:hypothetical protein